MSTADVMAMSGQQSGHQIPASSDTSSSISGMPANTSTAARVKVGVVEFNNKTKSAVSTSSLRDQLIAMLNGNGIDAIALNASSPSEAAMEAKAKQCAYILFTDIATMKAPSTGKKLGGLLGRATGIDTGGGGKAEAKFDFRLIPAGGSTPTVQSSATAKEDSEQASVNAALEAEAKSVAAAVPRM